MPGRTRRLKQNLFGKVLWTCCESPKCPVQGAINSWCDRMDICPRSGVPSCRFYQVRGVGVENCAGFRGTFHVRTGGKNEDDEICWTGIVTHRSCIHDRLREAFEERGVLPCFLEHGAALLADSGERIQPGRCAVHGDGEGGGTGELRSPG